MADAGEQGLLRQVRRVDFQRLVETPEEHAPLLLHMGLLDGTGGTPYMEWLRQLIEETRAFKIV